MNKFNWAQLFSNMSAEDKIKCAQLTLQRFNYAANYWNPIFVTGKKCMDYTVGKILTEEELAEMNEQDKLALQSPEALPKVNAIVGMLADSAKDGVVTAVQGEDAPGAEVINTILKCIERDNSLRRKELQAAQDSIITSVPTWVWLDGFDPHDNDKVGINLDLQPWDSVLPDPNWRDHQLRDMRFIIRIKQMTPDDIEDTYTEADITSVLNVTDPVNFGFVNATSDERDDLFRRVRDSRETYTRTGLINVIEMLHWVRTETIVWYDEETGDTVIPPSTWTPEQAMQWQQMHPTYQEIKQREKVLWVTTCTMDSKLLASGPHWLQCNRYPAMPYIPGMLNNKFIGLIESALSTLKAGVYAKTEWVHSLRTQNNNLWKMTDGAVPDLEAFQKERTRPGGTVVVSQGFTMQDVEKVENSQPQNAFMDWKQNEEDMLARLIVERNFEGGMQTSQESAKAINARITQVMARLAPMVYGWHEFRMGLRRLIVKAIPYTFTSHAVFRYFDPANGIVTAQVNAPDESVIGGINNVMNNLDGAEYDYIETESDNSVTGKEHERLLFREFMESYGNMPPEAVTSIALNYPSNMVQAFGRDLKQKQENTPPPTPAENAKMNISLDADKLGGNVLAQKIAVKTGLLAQEDIESVAQTQPAGGMPVEQTNPNEAVNV